MFCTLILFKLIFYFPKYMNYFSLRLEKAAGCDCVQKMLSDNLQRKNVQWKHIYRSVWT